MAIPLVRKQVAISQELEDELTAASERYGVSQAQIIREGVALWIEAAGSAVADGSVTA